VQFWDPHTGEAQLMLQGHKNSGKSFISIDYFRGIKTDQTGLVDDWDTNADEFVCSYLGGAKPSRPDVCDGKR
jgi:hypothetical protein